MPPLQWIGTVRLEGIKVEKNSRPKMSRADRAKQFAPFSALRGLYEALEAKEKEIELEKEQKTEPFTEC